MFQSTLSGISRRQRHPFSTAVSAAIAANSVPASPLPPPSFTIRPPVHPWPRRLTPLNLASLISRQHDPDLSLQIFHHAQSLYPSLSYAPQPLHALFLKLSRARRFSILESLLTRLPNPPPEPSLVILIRAYGLAGKPLSAVRLFLKLQPLRVRTSVKSLNALLNALVQNKRYRLAHSVFKSSAEKFGIVPDVVSCNILLKALCKSNEVDVAVRVLDEMGLMGLVPNVVSYTTVLGGYVFTGDMESAMKVFGEILDRGWVPDATTYTVLMSGFCRMGKFVEAIRVMDLMEENRVQANEVTYGVMIEAYCKGRKSGEAVNLLEDMVAKGFVPNSVLCCRVVDLLCEEGSVERAWAMCRGMVRKGIEVGGAVVSTIVHWLCKEGKVVEARGVLDELEKGEVASLLTYNTLIVGMCERGKLCEAARLWDDMVEKGRAPNAYTYNVLIKGFCKVGNVKEGIRVLEEMVESGCLPNKSTYSILVDGISVSGGKKEEIEKVVLLAMTSGVDGDLWELLLKLVINLDGNAAKLDRILTENAV
ncbi:pentatricopeptide repeat-containing protein At5g16420, mitochondrial [Vigna unguiculata]|uniref:Structure-specific endonuclease subunit SLX1 n=1 Tax=Vigna unguiculata TaxID=3917 RepID=A0A4D6NCU7_VIGUN|nr:pentatricopeptide repeat-containing protein At5g16420, mitochondrial [Vigna unguiculata]QCE11700.1 structure-specific endonuclease subunit SLX1 [Vigna unguiculata]